ncbi:hypothetical protein SDC9_93125 [bioreactor metagenome]|uniref:Uncharacterized protein n=1 Tax=bioreactor metagenome TaxID=1076179 RepID=A0A644ZZN3_9ZZZZ
MLEITPFDLHVLGTPPAFVLSQDQTLYYIKNILDSSVGSNSFLSRVSFRNSKFPRALFLLQCCLIFKVQCVLRLAGHPLIIPRESGIVKHFFQNLFLNSSGFRNSRIFIVPCAVRFVKHFLSKNSWNFLASCSFPPLADDFYNIQAKALFVNAFRHIFSTISKVAKHSKKSYNI